ncbi:MAG: lipopolysaccharide biosynthesis protein RfbH [Nitrospirae bacterium]|nr:lipopolysaccharide biosynthesis protein RfbH [Nitrospirota bacterium]MBF0534659.1 lipopolysaccharide biosynthesis protein RfbH [Nitrospirota bacterium]MBF0616297.1 lipopolysaccharide biosynthesis protein RfbH [Nitrospirota bacterium]
MKQQKHIGNIYEVKSTEPCYDILYVIAVTDTDESGDTECYAIKFTSSESKNLIALPPDTLSSDTSIDIRRKYLIKESDIVKKICTVSKKFLENVLKEIIFKEVGNYYEAIHSSLRTEEFIENKTKINYAGRIFNKDEMVNVVDAALEFYLTASRYDKAFCNKLSEFLTMGHNKPKRVLTANSGSSANLLAITALTSYKLGKFRLHKGDEVITVAAGFPTTITPIIQNNLVPVFVDIKLSTYNIDPELIEDAISEKTKAIFISHTLGIPFDVEQIATIAQKHGLWLIEDNCDAIGAQYTLTGQYNLIAGKTLSGTMKTGTFGHIGTSSFYPAHHITMGEGGAVYTSDDNLYRIMLSLRDWGRDCWCEPGSDNTCGRRFQWNMGDLPDGYDHKYIYSHLGYNLKITEMQAAIGLAQLDKLPAFVKSRRENWLALYEGLKDLEDSFILPSYPENSVPSPFGFALTIRENSVLKRKELTSFLEKNLIQTRTIFAGNMLKQPAFTNGDFQYRVYGELKNTDIVMDNTFWVGVYPGINKEMLDFMISKIRQMN